MSDVRKLTTIQTFKIATFIVGRAVDGKIDMRVGALRDEIERAIEIDACANSISKIAIEHEIELVRNVPGGATPEAKFASMKKKDARESGGTMDQVGFVKSMADLHRKLDAIIVAWDIKLPPL
jgi:hypothetical protein